MCPKEHEMYQISLFVGSISHSSCILISTNKLFLIISFSKHSCGFLIFITSLTWQAHVTTQIPSYIATSIQDGLSGIHDIDRTHDSYNPHEILNLLTDDYPVI